VIKTFAEAYGRLVCRQIYQLDLVDAAPSLNVLKVPPATGWNHRKAAAGVPVQHQGQGAVAPVLWLQRG
jgi:hypothetical protein